MSRVFLITAVCALCVLADSRLTHAGEAPWCALINMGQGAIHEECRYRTVEECVPNVIAGNRGYCNPNPRYRASVAPAGPKRRRVRQH